MTRQEFMDRVLLPLGRLTREEREAVRQELEEHIEDRMEAQLEMGWAKELAEARCLEAMGDPIEIGREMAKQYRGRWWIWIGRAAALLTAVLCVLLLFGLGGLVHARDSLEARIRPKIIGGGLDEVNVTETLDIRTEVGNDVLRIYQVSVGEKDGQPAAVVAACMYDRWPFGIVVNGLMFKSQLKNERGETGNSGSGRGNYGAEYAAEWTFLEPGDTYVVFEYQALGGPVQVTVPLPEGGAS